MFFKSFLIGIAGSVMIISGSFAAFNDDGTDYSKATTDKWVQDSSGDGLSMINAFVCIIKKSNGSTRPNATWRALIDEIKCGLQQKNDEGGGGVSLADTTMISTRATDISDQEILAYFASSSGENYIASMALNASTASAFDLTLDFRWYKSPDNTTPVDQAVHNNGWSEVSVSDNNSDGNMDTVIRHTETNPGQAFSSGALAITYGPDNAVTKFVSSNMDYEMGASGGKTFFQGVTDATKYRRIKYASDGTTQLADVCYDRSKEWANTHDYGLYDNVTGA